MKRVILIIFAIIIYTSTQAQNAPVAVDDYVNPNLGSIITVNVTDNDFHPDSLSFKIKYTYGPVLSFSDSTITYDIKYDDYFNTYPTDTIKFLYTLEDINGYSTNESKGAVNIRFPDNNYYDFLDFNNVRAQIQSFGHQFWKGSAELSSNPVFEFPKNSGKNTIFNSTLWVGGTNADDSLIIAAERYNQIGIDYWPGPLSINGSELSIDTSTVLQWQKVWKLTKEEIIYHKKHWAENNYEPIENIATWPAHGNLELNQAEYLAPFIDIDGDSIYNPMQGDYPLIRGDQCIYFIINDVRNHTESGGGVLGIEIHCMAYEFLISDNSPLNNTVFLSYKIFNRSNNTYNNTYVGVLTDIDIGYARDDYIGCDVQRGTYYAYNGDSIDGEGEPGTYGNFIPAQGVLILGGPLMNADGIDNPDGGCDESINGVGFGDDVVDNERYGMANFIYFNNGGNQAQSDPQTSQDYYGYLKGIWRDGTVMEYGGNGHVNSGAYGPQANFMFPNLTDPCYWGTGGEEPYGPVEWTEVTAGNEPEDRRGLSSMGPFTFEPGSMKRVDIAYVSAFPDGENTAIEQLMQYVDFVKNEYKQDPTYFGYQWLGVEEDRVESNAINLLAYPNPVNDMLTFIYKGDDNNATYKLTEITGKEILSGNISQNKNQIINLSGLNAGIFILSITDARGIYATKVIKR